MTKKTLESSSSTFVRRKRPRLNEKVLRQGKKQNQKQDIESISSSPAFTDATTTTTSIQTEETPNISSSSSNSNNNNNNKNNNRKSDIISSPPPTTRVCFKNIPASFDENSLREHIKKHSSSTKNIEITDCHILRTPDEKKVRRNMAFVGFKSHEMASHVICRFHQTYAQTSRLIVEPAFSKQNRPMNFRPWSKHSVGSSRHTKRTQQQEENEIDKSISNKPQSTTTTITTRTTEEEFLLAITGNSTKKEGLKNNKKSGRAKIWSNDDDDMFDQGRDTEMEARIINNEKKTSPSQVDDSHTDSEDEDPHDDDDDEEEEMNAQPMKPMTDMDFLKSKTKQIHDFSDDDDDDDDDKGNETTEKVHENKEAKDHDSDSSSVPDSSDDDDTDDDTDDDDDDHTDEENEEQNVKNMSQSKDLEIKKQTMKQQDSHPTSFTQQQQQQQQTNLNATTDDIQPSRLFLRNLPFSTTEDELRTHFSTFGTLQECHIPVDDERRGKGFGFVQFISSDDANAAHRALDGTDFQGRVLYIHPAKREYQPNDDNNDDDNNNRLTYKQKQERLRKTQHNGQPPGYATMGSSASFVRGDAVIDNLSHRLLGLQKGDLLNVKDSLTSGGAAVRLALGETHIIEENRLYFRQHGIDMDALVSSDQQQHQQHQHQQANADAAGTTLKRSNTMILVKNLPYDTTVEELTKLFHGIVANNNNTNHQAEPKQILLPPSRTIALVKYDHSSDSKRAFRKLAYKRFKHVPLYLEWAPLCNIQDDNKVMNDDDDDLVNTNVKDMMNNDIDEENETTTTSTSSSSSSSYHSIYVKNLNFHTTEDQLSTLFEKVGKVRAVRIPKKLAPLKKKKNKNIITKQENEEEAIIMQKSMGYGFVEFETEHAVKIAIQTMNGIIVDGHSLELKISEKKLTSSSSSTQNKETNITTTTTKKKKKKKIMVRNVPFQATRLELLQLFGSFGQLKKVRLPKKFDGSHRGFAFVEFLTEQEALNAMNSLSRTHLYGRHLVLEWADNDDDDDDGNGNGGGNGNLHALREKAQRDVSRSSRVKKRKKT